MLFTKGPAGVVRALGIPDTGRPPQVPVRLGSTDDEGLGGSIGGNGGDGHKGNEFGELGEVHCGLDECV